MHPAEYGSHLGKAMQMLGSRATIMSGGADAATLRTGNELMATLSEHMHSALPEQRAIASQLIQQAIGDIATYEQRHVGAPAHGHAGKHTHGHAGKHTHGHDYPHHASRH